MYGQVESHFLSPLVFSVPPTYIFSLFSYPLPFVCAQLSVASCLMSPELQH